MTRTAHKPRMLKAVTTPIRKVSVQNPAHIKARADAEWAAMQDPREVQAMFDMEAQMRADYEAECG